jgi:alanyl-tRNA synthetase
VPRWARPPSATTVQIALDRTPFYAESGGQVGDVGTLTNAGARFRVTDTKKLGDAHLHIGKVEVGSFRKATKSPPPSMRRRGSRRYSTIPPRTCCTRRFARCSATT